MYKMPERFARNGRNVKAYCILLVFLTLLVVPHWSRSQTPTSASAVAQKALPRTILYTQVFKHVAFLDSQADVADRHGEDGGKFRNYYQMRAGLTPSEATLLRTTAHDALAALEKVDQQIQTQVTIYRQQFHNGRVPAGQPLPKAPPEMRTLQQEKDNVVLSHIAALETGFGAARFQHLDAYVLAAVAPHITIARPKAPARPNAEHLPPLQPAPWK